MNNLKVRVFVIKVGFYEKTDKIIFYTFDFEYASNFVKKKNSEYYDTMDGPFFYTEKDWLTSFKNTVF